MEHRTVICSNCRQENAESNDFCMFCGSPLAVEPTSEDSLAPGTHGGPPPDEETQEGLQDQVDSLRNDLDELRTALTGYFSLRNQPSAREVVRILQQRQAAPPRPRVRSPREELQRTEEEARPSDPGGPHPSPQVSEWVPEDETVRPASPVRMPWDGIDVDWEWLVGGNWLARIGVIAVVFGMGFFLKLAFDNDWINETGRVALGIAGGLAMLGAGEYWRSRYQAYAQALAGGGIALLYLSIFAAFAIFGLISLYPAVGLLLLISVASAVLAIRYESMAMAIIGIFGAFSAPWVTGAFAPSDPDVAQAGPTVQLMVYVMVVDLGVLALSTLRNWHWFTRLALAGSLISFGAWYGEHGDEAGLLAAQTSITGIFLIFVGATTFFHLIRRRAPDAFDYSLMLTNAVAYFGISYALLWVEFRDWMGGFTLVLSLFYGLIAYIAYLRNKEHPHLTLMAVGIALVLLTVVVPVQLGGAWVSVAWAAEAAVLLWLSLTLRMWVLRSYSAVVFAAVAVRLLAIDTPDALSDGVAFSLNEYLAPFLVAIGAAYLSAYLLRRYKDALHEVEEPIWYPAMLVLGSVFLTVAIPVHIDGAWMAVAWAAEATGIMWLSLRLGVLELRASGIGVFVILAIRLLAIDAPDAIDADLTPFYNQYLVPFLVAIGAAYLAAYLVRRHTHRLTDYEKRVWFPGLLAAGTVFLTVAVPVQVEGVWIAVGWAIQSAALMWLAFRLGIYELKLASVGVFAILAVRLLAVETTVDLVGFRVILNDRMLAFGAGILALYVGAYFAGRRLDTVWEWERFLTPGLLVSASFLTLWVVSAEVIAAVDSGIVNVTGQAADHAKSLGLSLVWSVYGGIALVSGIVRGWRMVRLGGLLLLAITVLKLFLIDSFALEQGYRVAAFLSLGMILLIGGYLYQRYSELIKGFLFEEEKSSPSPM